MEREGESIEKQRNLVNLLRPGVPGCAPDTRESNPIIRQERHTADQSSYHLSGQIDEARGN